MRSGQNYKPVTPGASKPGNNTQVTADDYITEPLAAMFNLHDPAFIKYALFSLQSAFIKHPEALKDTDMPDEVLAILNNLYGFFDEYDTVIGRQYVGAIIKECFPTDEELVARQK